MKKLLSLILLLSWLRPALAKTPAGRQRLSVASVVFPGMEVLDMTDPLDVLLTASNLTNGSYHCYTVALTNAELTTDRGSLHLRPDHTFATAPKPVVVVPGGPGVPHCQRQPAFMTQLKALSGRAAQTRSVCTGALLLAQAGVLDGRTHQGTTDALARQFSKVRLVRDVRDVVDGPVFTTAGVTAGIDGAFYLVEQHSGSTVAAVVASTMQYPRLDVAQAQKPSAHPTANLFDQAALPTGQLVRPAARVPLASFTDPVCHMSIHQVGRAVSA
jgi:transcriptional regulator GlxA family with amidase domain